MFKGALTALITPFKNGEVDEKKLKDLIEWQISEGINGLVPVGTTGESATLSHKEHSHVIDLVVKAARKRVPVLAGAGSNSTREAIELTKEARDLKADAVSSVCPYYNKPSQEGLKAHFSAIAAAVDIPIVLYNIPSRTNVNLLSGTIAQLHEAHKNIVGVKDATGGVDQSMELLKLVPGDFCILSGDDAITLPLMSVGAKGVISVAANIVPKDVVELCRLIEAGEEEKAQALSSKLFPLVKALFIETNPTPIKAAMKELGLIESDELRLPMVPVQAETRSKIKSALKAYGVKTPTGVK